MIWVIATFTLAVALIYAFVVILWADRIQAASMDLMRGLVAATEKNMEERKRLEAENGVLREQNYAMNKTIVDGIPMGPVGATYGMPGTDMCPNCVTPWKCNGPHLDAAPQASSNLPAGTREDGADTEGDRSQGAKPGTPGPADAAPLCPACEDNPFARTESWNAAVEASASIASDDHKATNIAEAIRSLLIKLPRPT
jgi:hypothetical protein